MSGVVSDWANWTWKCHVCNEERPDHCISVARFESEGRVKIGFNVRYCNDRETCEAGAVAVAERWASGIGREIKCL